MTTMTTPDYVSHFRKHGYAVTPALLDGACLDVVRGVFARIEADAGQGGKMYRVRNNLFPSGLHRQFPEMARFLRHPVLIKLARQICGDNIDQVWNQAIIKPAKTGGHFAWHQDARYGITDPLDGGFTLWVAINKTTIANGTLWVAPQYWSRGLLPHVWNDEHKEWQARFDGEPEPASKQPVELEAGQMLIFSRLIPHASGANITDSARLAYQIAYAPPGCVAADTREPFGDRVPVLRDGEVVE
jgi:phytanoyl-CoA hydroxylase